MVSDTLKVRIKIDSDFEKQLETAVGKAFKVAKVGFDTAKKTTETVGAGILGLAVFGYIAEGIKKTNSFLESIAPPIQALNKLFGTLLTIFFMPFATFMVSLLAPFLIMAIKFVRSMDKSLLIVLGGITAAVIGLYTVFGGSALLKAVGLGGLDLSGIAKALAGVGTKIWDIITNPAIWSALGGVGGQILKFISSPIGLVGVALAGVVLTILAIKGNLDDAAKKFETAVANMKVGRETLTAEQLLSEGSPAEKAKSLAKFALSSQEEANKAASSGTQKGNILGILPTPSVQDFEGSFIGKLLGNKDYSNRMAELNSEMAKNVAVLGTVDDSTKKLFRSAMDYLNITVLTKDNIELVNQAIDKLATKKEAEAAATAQQKAEDEAMASAIQIQTLGILTQGNTVTENKSIQEEFAKVWQTTWKTMSEKTTEYGGVIVRCLGTIGGAATQAKGALDALAQRIASMPVYNAQATGTMSVSTINRMR